MDLISFLIGVFVGGIAGMYMALKNYDAIKLGAASLERPSD